MGTAKVWILSDKEIDFFSLISLLKNTKDQNPTAN